MPSLCAVVAVTIERLCARPRWVTGIPTAAGAAIAELTPGTTSNGTPASAQASASSPPRPNTNGSPPLSRTTARPDSARSTSSAEIASCSMAARPGSLPTYTRSVCRGARRSSAGEASRS